MTTTPTPLRVTQLQEAEDLGEIAGRRHRDVASELCNPEDWTDQERRKWCALLTILATNPYEDDEYPVDMDDNTRTACARRFALAFERADRARKHELRRIIA